MEQLRSTQPPGATRPGVGPVATLRRVEVVATDGGHGVMALEPIESGQAILHIHGEPVARPSKYSLQVDTDLHIEHPWVEGAVQEPARDQWRYLNHSCEPNAALVGLTLVALRPIGEGEEITFDYNTTEFEMSTPFMCQCGHCGGALIRGFKFLDPAQKRRLQPRLAEHLRRTLV
jgi:hypothetical protein